MKQSHVKIERKINQSYIVESHLFLYLKLIPHLVPGFQCLLICSVANDLF
jgi:hypothetical protein